MKRVLPIIIVLTLLFGGAGWYLVQKLLPPTAESAVLDPLRGALADRFLDHLDAGRFDDALAMTTPRMRDGLGGGKLAETWEALPEQLGLRTARGNVRGESIDGKPIVSAKLVYPVLALDARIIFDEHNAISGFWIVPARDSTAEQAHVAESAENWSEVEVDIGEARSRLPGTLTLPHGNGPFPAVVLVHGSGAHDRDATIGPNKPFRDLAHGLAGHGIAVLRYVKRTKMHPQQFIGVEFTINEETVDDALAATATLRGNEKIDAHRIFIAGHSLGALVAPRIGERDARIAGLILLAAPARRLDDIVIAQMRYLAAREGRSEAEISADVAPLEHQRETVRQLVDGATHDQPLMLNLPASYWLDLNRYDPLGSARTIAQPMLILQGGLDYQVTLVDDFARWQAAFSDDSRVRLIHYPLLGHMFMPGSDPPSPKDYERVAHVDADVITDLAQWIASVAARSAGQARRPVDTIRQGMP